MPKMNAAELAEVVPGEIEKIPFFYNQAFEYSYTAFMHSREKDRVLLVAVSQEFLKSVIDEIDATKLPFRDIEISPLNMKEILSMENLQTISPITFLEAKKKQTLIIQKMAP